MTRLWRKQVCEEKEGRWKRGSWDQQALKEEGQNMMFLSIYFPRLIRSSNAKFKAKLNFMQSINNPWRLSPLKTTETKTLRRVQRPRHLKKKCCLQWHSWWNFYYGIQHIFKNRKKTMWTWSFHIVELSYKSTVYITLEQITPRIKKTTRAGPHTFQWYKLVK